MTMKPLSIVIAISFALISYGNAQGIVSYGGYINSTSSSYITIGDGGNLTLDDYSATAVIADLDGNTIISGHLINNTSSANILAASTGLIEFNGVGTQNIYGPTNFKLNSIKISNYVELATDIIVPTAVILNSSYLVLGDYNLTVENGGNITGYSSSSYIIPEGAGKLLLYATVGGSPINFPMGTSTSYTPATITLTSGTDQYFKGGVIDGVWSNGTTGTNLALSDPMVNRTWILTADATHQVDISMQWSANDHVNGFDPSSAVSNIYDSQWNTQSATITGSDPYTLSLTGLNDINNDAIHAVSASSVSLPIELMRFYGNYDGKVVMLNWSTATENDNDYFTVERSTNINPDGSQWKEIGSIKANGNSNAIINYNFNDNIPNTEVQVNYYRLKQVDFDGKYSYSNIVPIHILTNDEILVYPNPSSNGIFQIQGITNIQIEVYNNTGQLIKILENNATEIDISDYPSGIYYIKYNNTFFKIIK